VKEVVSSIKKCWASLWEERVVKYLNNLGKSEIVPKMGVVIQQMIDSFASGVVFTLHPTTGIKEFQKRIILMFCNQMKSQFFIEIVCTRQ
jgi:phosphoenolpyruvate synthase/pyruvate phosphate dikinase